MGVVAAATHVHLKERVALKFLSTRAHAQAADFHSRFRREAQVSAKLRNEHITRVIDVGIWREQVPFMVMDHLVGHDLRRTLKQAPNGRLPTAVALDYIVQVCEGLAEAHSHGIVHRDLKPSNLFVTKRHDGTDLIKILDFGISKWSTQEEQLDELTQTGVVLGSPKYMAPEQLFGSATVDARADVWSIGAIFYEMLTGKPPYDFPTLTRICAELAADRPPPSLRQFVPDVPPQLEAVLMQCFARDREQRISNVAEFAGALLESVDAPFAGQVRQKIATMLDPKGQGAGLTTSSGPSALGNTGDFRSLALNTSTPSITTSGALRLASEGIPPSAATAGGSRRRSLSEAPGAGKRKAIVGRDRRARRRAPRRRVAHRCARRESRPQEAAKAPRRPRRRSPPPPRPSRLRRRLLPRLRRRPSPQRRPRRPRPTRPARRRRAHRPPRPSTVTAAVIMAAPSSGPRAAPPARRRRTAPPLTPPPPAAHAGAGTDHEGQPSGGSPVNLRHARCWLSQFHPSRSSFTPRSPRRPPLRHPATSRRRTSARSPRCSSSPARG